MRIGDKQLGDKILITRFHAGTPFTATTLRPIDGQRHALDVAAMADRHYHVFLLDQIFIILIGQLIRNFRPARIVKTLTGGGKFGQHNLIDSRCRSENIQIVSNLFSQLLCFLGQLITFHAGQTLQAQIKDCAGLGF